MQESEVSVTIVVAPARMKTPGEERLTGSKRERAIALPNQALQFSVKRLQV